MDEIEIIQLKIPLDCYEKKTVLLIDTLLKIDEILFTDAKSSEVA